MNMNPGMLRMLQALMQGQMGDNESGHSGFDRISKSVDGVNSDSINDTLRDIPIQMPGQPTDVPGLPPGQNPVVPPSKQSEMGAAYDILQALRGMRRPT